MQTGVFFRNGIEVRRLKSGHRVREDEWQEYVKINKVSSSHLFIRLTSTTPDIGLGLVRVIYAEERTV